jgi:restriction system protein
MESNDKLPENTDPRDMSLDEWLNSLFNPPDDKRIWSFSFLTNEHFDEYLKTINQRTEEEVLCLLRNFLISSGSLGCDKRYFDDLMSDLENNEEVYEFKMRLTFYRRLFLYSTGFWKGLPWEGNTWVLDLLPHFPKQALEALNAYILAHIQLLPDGKMNGLYDAASIIRAKFIGFPGTQSEKVKVLIDLDPRDFEFLVERLYRRMDYDTQLTTKSKDGGYDIIAHKILPGRQEKLRIECKRYTKPVGVGIVRSLLGVVSDEKVNKGILVTTNRFTKPAHKFASQNPRLELLDGDQLVPLMNEHLGPDWPLHIERLIKDSRRDYKVRKQEVLLFENAG